MFYVIMLVRFLNSHHIHVDPKDANTGDTQSAAIKKPRQSHHQLFERIPIYTAIEPENRKHTYIILCKVDYSMDDLRA